jgi:FkbM family methyltransferase
MAAGVGTTGMVLAFEPQAELAACLQETLAMGCEADGGAEAHPRFEVHQKLISNGVEELSFCNNGTGRSRIPITSNAQQMKLTENWPVQTLCSTTIDLTVLGRLADDSDGSESVDRTPTPRVCLIKIDVEGHDFQVLEGAEGTITRDRPIIYIEVWQEKGEVLLRKKKWRTDHSAFARLEQWAKGHFYLIERLTANDYRLRPLPPTAAAAAVSVTKGGATEDAPCELQEQLWMLRLLGSLEEQKRSLLDRGTDLRRELAAIRGVNKQKRKKEERQKMELMTDPVRMEQWFEAELQKLPVWELYPEVAKQAVVCVRKWLLRFPHTIWQRFVKQKRLIKEVNEIAPVIQMVVAYVAAYTVAEAGEGSREESSSSSDVSPPNRGGKLTVIDLCCGFGFLSMILSEILPPDKLDRFILIDKCWPHHTQRHADVKPNQINHDHLYEDRGGGGGWPIPLVPRKADLKSGYFQRDLSSNVFDKAPGPTLILAVHLCGTLAIRAVEIFNEEAATRCARSSMDAAWGGYPAMLVLKPCCLPGTTLLHQFRDGVKKEQRRMQKEAKEKEGGCLSGGVAAKEEIVQKEEGVRKEEGAQKEEGVQEEEGVQKEEGVQRSSAGGILKTLQWQLGAHSFTPEDAHQEPEVFFRGRGECMECSSHDAPVRGYRTGASCSLDVWTWHLFEGVDVRGKDIKRLQRIEVHPGHFQNLFISAHRTVPPAKAGEGVTT